jgi:hypothetical protein
VYLLLVCINTVRISSTKQHQQRRITVSVSQMLIAAAHLTPAAHHISSSPCVPGCRTTHLKTVHHTMKSSVAALLLLAVATTRLQLAAGERLAQQFVCVSHPV